MPEQIQKHVFNCKLTGVFDINLAPPYQEVILKVWVSNAITRCWCKNLFSLKAPRIYGDNWTATVLLLDINKSHLLSSKQIMEPI